MNVADLLDIVDGRPRRVIDLGEVLLVDGRPVPALYVLVEGALRIEKAGTPITKVTTPGACVGEMSLLLDVPATADVVASERSIVAVVDDAPRCSSRIRASRSHSCSSLPFGCT